MFHLLSCFDLKPESTIDAFNSVMQEFVELMQSQQLAHRVGSVGRRQRHPIMDTDKERDQEYFFIMSFVDIDQCDLAVKSIQGHHDPQDSVHNKMIEMITNPIFICWEDIAPHADFQS